MSIATLPKTNGHSRVPIAETVLITPPNFGDATFALVGVSPYVQAKFSEKAKAQIRDKMLAGSTARKGQKRQPRDFDSDFEGAQHIATEGWNGIPASAFRNAMIDACRAVGFQMTKAKMSLFVEADGFDRDEGTPLVMIDSPAPPERMEMATRNATGVVDLRVRPMWRTWGVKLRLRWDADQFTLTDVANLLARAGLQVGIGEGRPFSKSSAGLGYGLFRIEEATGA